MTASIEEIRRKLREKFPQAHGFTPVAEPVEEAPQVPFEIATFPPATISEIIPAGKDCGLSLWIAGLLGEPEEMADFPKFVLVDGSDNFDPASHSSAACSQLLWVRCSRILDALKATDLLVRDANIPFVMLDLCGVPTASLKSITSSAWWRLKQLCETGSCRLVVMAPFTLVPCASLRLTLSSNLKLADFNLPRSEILQRMSARTDLRRHVT